MTAPYVTRHHATFSEFELAIDRATQALDQKADLFVKGVTQTLFNEIQSGGRYSPGTPIDTGLARASWVGGLNSEPPAAIGEELLPTDEPGAYAGQAAAAARELEGVALNAKAGDTVHFANRLPYIRRLEYGHSQRQAPNGMVRLALDAAPLIVEEVAAHLWGPGA